MARAKGSVPTGLYTVKMYAYCGMSYAVAEGLDRASAITAIARLAERRRQTGHDVTETIGRSGLPEYEFGEPADCALVPDTAGTAAIVAETRPAIACWDCDELVAIGEVCPCHEDRASVDDDEVTA